MSKKNGRVDPNVVLVQYGADALRQCVTRAMQEFDQKIEVATVSESSESEADDAPAGESAHTTAPQSDAMQIQGDRVIFRFADRIYEVDGMSRNRAPGTLSLTFHAMREEHLFADKLEIYSEKERVRFLRLCALALHTEEAVIRSDFTRMHVKLRERQDHLLAEAATPQSKRVVPPISESDRRVAMEFLTSTDLIGTIFNHFRESGYVGEQTGLLAGYIVATSRLLPKPLHVIYQSSSAAGKTTLMKAVVSMMPPEVVFGYSSISPKALQYMQDRDMRHSIFLLEEDRRLDDSAREMIKLLKSEGRAASAVTIKDPDTGMMRAVDFLVEGPISFLMTTTALAMDEEQSNRDLVCSADESREQTARILAMQRRLSTLEGRDILERRAEIRRLHQNAQRLLRPLTIINPYAVHMTFPEHAHRLRRDHEKYLGLIEAVTLLHQYHREIKARTLQNGVREEYIEVTIEDIETANAIASTVLGRSLDDCPPHTKGFLEQAITCVAKEAERHGVEKSAIRLTATALAQFTGISVQMVRRHLARLMDLELVYVDGGDGHSGERRNNPFRRYAFSATSTGEKHFLAGFLNTDAIVRRHREKRVSAEKSD
jgi:DNA primase